MPHSAAKMDRNLMEEISSLFLHEVPKNEQAIAKQFLKSVFDKSVYNDIEKLSPSAIAEIFFDLWEVAKIRKSGEAKTAVYTFDPGNGPHSSRLIINIINENMPFLVDSVVGYLSRVGLRSKVMMRPILRICRDRDGMISDISESPRAMPGYLQEAVIHCEITDPVDDKIADKVRTELPRIMSDISYAVSDWMDMRTRVQLCINDLKPVPGVLSADKVAELIDFLQWMDSDHFTFLGYREYEVSPEGKLFDADPSKGLGILRDPQNNDVGVLYQGVPIGTDTLSYIFRSDIILVTKTSNISNVHRSVPMDSICFKKFNGNGQVIAVCQFIGLFTSMAYSSSARDIPLLRRKVLSVVDKAGYSPQWHDGKSIIHILDTLPRDELFQASEEELLTISTKVLAIQESPKVAFFIRRDHFDRFLSCLVYVPRDRFDYNLTERMGDLLQDELNCPVTLSSAQYGSISFARVHYTASMSAKQIRSFKYDEDRLESLLTSLAHSWREELRSALNSSVGDWDGARVFEHYGEAFSKGYQEKFDANEAVIDINYFEKAISENCLQMRLYRPSNKPAQALKLKLYNKGDVVTLAEAFPVLANLDLRIIGEIPFTVRPEHVNETFWVHDFESVSRGDCSIDIAEVEDKFLTMFRRVWSNEVENDGFNRLVLRAGLDWRECQMVRAYCKYMRQITIPFSQDYIEETVVKNPDITKMIADLFSTRFDPKLERSMSEKSSYEIYEKILEELDKVENPDEDRILRQYANLVMSTLRTNYYQRQEDGDFKPYLTFKFDCSNIEAMPKPKPMFEIFVYSPRFEAVHLRGGKVARGGIRWSDRREDFRTEILGLLKAQMVKNSVIVPVGSKGGFVLKQSIENMTREELLIEGQECYSLMMHALLDITDNLIDGNVIPPSNVVRMDGGDPYLVVAADKGTATFSDLANSISESHGFWLGDAFASGGSAGYDHKKMGITARGAWESVKRHFWEIGIDVSKDDFTVAGVGDMGGDVFGNGMLLSKCIKLQAAFNHRHIFIDPNPNPSESYEERKRLFENRLGWDGYDKTLISKGGGVFERSSKNITLTPEMKALLEINKDTASPGEIMHGILRLQVDLLWFGGIGTYIKSKNESHTDAGDRANDAIRLNANELRCQVIGEGANLGVTQLGRIEFAKREGHINTDAIDNSGGVDSSDHEVNIKILLQLVMNEKKLTRHDRDKLLVTMTDQVAEHVLQTNYDQNLSISVFKAQGSRILDMQVKLMRYLEKSGRLDRALEFLPDDPTLLDMQKTQSGLTRPELAVLMSYAKNAFYETLLNSNVSDEPLIHRKLYSYFPSAINEQYKNYIEQHPLRKEIITTVVANEIVNRMGGGFVNEMVERTTCTSADVLRAYYVVNEIYGYDELWSKIESLGATSSPEQQIKAFLRIIKLTRRSVQWFLKNYRSAESMMAGFSIFQSGIGELKSVLSDTLVGSIKDKVEADIQSYMELGLDDDSAKSFAHIEIIASSPEIILSSSETMAPVSEVATVYFAAGSRFYFNRFRIRADLLSTNDEWNRAAVSAIIEDMYSFQNLLTKNIINYFVSTHSPLPESGIESVNIWTRKHHDKVKHIDQVLKDGLSVSTPDLALIAVINRELRLLSEI